MQDSYLCKVTHADSSSDVIGRNHMPAQRKKTKYEVTSISTMFLLKTYKAHAHARTHAGTHLSTHAHMHAGTHAGTHVRMHTCTHRAAPAAFKPTAQKAAEGVGR